MTELRTYKPLHPTNVPPEHRKWVNKVVKVNGWYPTFDGAGHIPQNLIPLHLCKWWGYVEELERKIPETELHKVVYQPEDHCEGNMNS